jgi:lysophospholipase L1-like esterase
VFEENIANVNHEDDFMLADGIHLSKKGHEIYANAVIDELVIGIRNVIGDHSCERKTA